MYFISKMALAKRKIIFQTQEGNEMSRKNTREEFIFTNSGKSNKVFNPVLAVFPASADETRTYTVPEKTTTIGYISRGSAVISAIGSDFKVSSKETFVIEKVASDKIEIKIAPDSTVSWFSCNGTLPDALTSAYTTPAVGIRHLDISTLMLKIKEILSLADGNIDLTCEKALSEYFFEALSDFYYSADPVNDTAAKRKLSEAERIRIYIDNMIYSDPSLDDVKDHFGITKMHAIRVFKAKYKQTPMQYAIERRTEVAGTLLATTDLPIKTISEMLHYSNTQHFSNSFKKLTGQSPNQYRQNAKKK